MVLNLTEQNCSNHACISNNTIIIRLYVRYVHITFNWNIFAQICKAWETLRWSLLFGWNRRRNTLYILENYTYVPTLLSFGWKVKKINSHVINILKCFKKNLYLCKCISRNYIQRWIKFLNIVYAPTCTFKNNTLASSTIIFQINLKYYSIENYYCLISLTISMRNTV